MGGVDEQLSTNWVYSDDGWEIGSDLSKWQVSMMSSLNLIQTLVFAGKVDLGSNEF